MLASPSQEYCIRIYDSENNVCYRVCNGRYEALDISQCAELVVTQ